MSNCVTIHHSYEEFHLSKKDFKVEEFKKFQIKAEKDINNDNSSKYEDGLDNERCIWWFAPPFKTFVKEDGGIVIMLGQGRSGHTWRDFKWLLQILSKFVINKMKLTFVLRDEGGGGFGIAKYTLEPNKVTEL